MKSLNELKDEVRGIQESRTSMVKKQSSSTKGTRETKIFSAGGNAELRATRRPAFDNWMENGVKVNGQGFKMNQHAYNSLFKSGRKDIMPDDITGALSKKPTLGEPGEDSYEGELTNPLRWICSLF